MRAARSVVTGTGRLARADMRGAVGKVMNNSRFRRLLPITAMVSIMGLAGVGLTACQARPGEAPTVAAPRTSSASQNSGTIPEELRTLTAGIDAIPSDINPHLVGSRSLATSIVASLTLPSAFAEAEGASGAEGPTASGGHRTELNTDLLESATVTAGDPDAPVAVRYVVRSTAQWSDGTPITGADFTYLRDQMSTMPGVSDPAGYLRIDSIKSTAGGRTIDVTFTEPAVGWRDLFANLLPSHIYRSEDRSFSTMMAGVPAASGGVFRVHSVDSTRGIIELDRNERYWGTKPAQVDRLVLSVVPDVTTASQMLRTGQVQMLMLRDRGVTAESLSAVPGARVRVMARRPDLVLTLNPSAPRMAATSQRARIADAVNTSSVARILTSNPLATAPSAGTASTPSTLSMSPTDLVSPAVPVDLPSVGSDLTPLRIGAERSDARAVEAARRVVDQLVNAGISATVVARPAADFYGSFLPSGEVDAMVAWQEKPETLTELRSRYGCGFQGRQVSQPSSALPSAMAIPTSSTAPTSPASSTSTSSTDRDDDGKDTDSATASPGRTANIAGVCSAEIDSLIDSAEAAVSSGENSDPSVVIDQVIGLVDQWNIDIPLVDDDFVIAAGVDLVGPGPRLASWPLDRGSGPFLSAGQWRRSEEKSMEAVPSTSTRPSAAASATVAPSAERKRS